MKFLCVKTVPAELDVPCIVDNYGSHQHPKVKAWLAARPRWHMHFMPTYSSWRRGVNVESGVGRSGGM
ncbi:MAG: hypothetical protein VB137_10175 [Burkholderia sp.]